MPETALAQQGYEQRVVTARVAHRCFDCDRTIPAGTAYLTYLAAPWHDMNQMGRWVRVAFCRDCSPHAPEWGETPHA